MMDPYISTSFNVDQPVIQKTLVEMIEQNWLEHNIAFLYLDIIKFQEMKDKYGEIVSQKVLCALEKNLVEMKIRNGYILEYYLIGDDLLIYILLDQLEEQNQQKMLEMICNQIVHQLRQTANYELEGMNERIDFHTGYSYLVPDSKVSIEELIQSTVEQVAENIKKGKKDEHDQLQNEFTRILDHKTLSIHYQPIISLSLGEIFGYEALTRGPLQSYFHSPIQLFRFAQSEGKLYQLEKIVRELAIHRSNHFISPQQKLFINVNSQVFFDPAFISEYMMQLLNKYNLSPKNIIFEITERNPILNFASYKSLMKHYRELGFQIAIDDAGSGYSSLQAISELRPDFIKVDRSLIENVNQNKVKEKILETFVYIARQINAKVIAEGIETPEELAKVTRLGIHFGQGYLLAKPNFPPFSVSEQALEWIDKNKRLQNLDHISKMNVEQITSPVKVFDVLDKVEAVSVYFKEHTDELGVAIKQNNRPVGLVMREKLNQELVKPYGVSLFWKQPVQLLMDPNPLIVEHTVSIDVLAQTVITRDYRQMYDYVIVTKEDKILGIVSIQNILDFLANVKMEMVSQANPLSGLPGNKQINKEINQRLNDHIKFALIYADINHFKWFNDRYGFQRGDQVIKHLSDILQDIMIERGSAADFVGHVGGDDFVIITLPDNAMNISNEVIHRFDQQMPRFYDHPEEMLEPVYDRSGNPVASRGLSISLALIDCQHPEQNDIGRLSQISADIKKEAKKKQGSNVTYHKC